jgi:hypothetical protein
LGTGGGFFDENSDVIASTTLLKSKLGINEGFTDFLSSPDCTSNPANSACALCNLM